MIHSKKKRKKKKVVYLSQERLEVRKSGGLIEDRNEEKTSSISVGKELRDTVYTLRKEGKG